MDNSTKQSLGCFTLIFIGILVWIGFRSDSVGQFFAMAGIWVLVIVFAFLALVGWVSEGAGYKLMGIVFTILTGLTLVAVGMFLFSGNYSRGMRVVQVWKWGQPMAVQVNEEPQVASTRPPVTKVMQPGAEVAVTEPAKDEPTKVEEEKIEPTKAPTATLSSQPTSTETPPATFMPIPDMEKAGDLTVPPGGEQAYGQVTDTLNNIWKTPKGKASALASRLSQQAATLSGDQQLNAFLFTAVAHQRAGEMNTARDFYQKLLASPETPHANTASYQLRMLETEPDNLKAQIKTLREVFGKAEKEGWYLHQDNWAFTDSRTTAAKSLITLQADQISFRFFDLIYQRSIFPKEYAYLFIFLVVLLAAKLITLPLSFRSQQFMVKLREAQPEIDWINSTYSDNPTEKSKQLMSLYQSRGINYWSGCLVGIVDLVFVVWFFLTVRSFAPQFYLDGARFWLADDITVFSLMLILAWIGVMMVQSFVTYLSQPKTTTAWQTGCGGLVFFAIVAAVAYYFKTPAYGFILYGILALGSLLVSLILMPFATIASKR